MKSVNRHPVQFTAAEHICKYILVVTDDNFICFRAYFHHENRAAHGKVQPLSLAHRIVGNAPMTAQNIAVQVHEVSVRQLPARVFLNK